LNCGQLTTAACDVKCRMSIGVRAIYKHNLYGAGLELEGQIWLCDIPFITDDKCFLFFLDWIWKHSICFHILEKLG